MMLARETIRVGLNCLFYLNFGNLYLEYFQMCFYCVTITSLFSSVGLRGQLRPRILHPRDGSGDLGAATQQG